MPMKASTWPCSCWSYIPFTDEEAEWPEATDEGLFGQGIQPPSAHSAVLLTLLANAAVPILWMRKPTLEEVKRPEQGPPGLLPAAPVSSFSIPSVAE